MSASSSTTRTVWALIRFSYQNALVLHPAKPTVRVQMATILVSEPHAEVRELVVHVIEAMGWDARTSTATDPDAVDLLLVEPGWPDGLALAQRMRDARPDLPIVCLSIYPRELDVELLLPTAYLVKPFSVAELQGALRNALAAGTVAFGAASAPLSHQTQ